MSKENATFILANMSKPVISWDSAIADAEIMIRDAQSRITQLRQAIKAFQLLRDKGEPFPGGSASQVVPNRDSKRRKSTESHHP